MKPDYFSIFHKLQIIIIIIIIIIIASLFREYYINAMHNNLFITLLLGSIAYTVVVKQPCYI